MYKALSADDEEIIRSGLSRLLARDPDFEVAALAEDGEQALELAAELGPAVQRFADVLETALR